MKLLPILGLSMVLATGPALAQGSIGTLARGPYVCELPGDAAGEAGIAQPEAGFAIIGSSRYSTAQGTGTYLRRGNVVTFTGGPRTGESYAVMSSGFLRRMENGKAGKLRCVHRG